MRSLVLTPNSLLEMMVVCVKNGLHPDTYIERRIQELVPLAIADAIFRKLKTVGSQQSGVRYLNKYRGYILRVGVKKKKPIKLKPMHC